jgi:hypothetical protein
MKPEMMMLKRRLRGTYAVKTLNVARNAIEKGRTPYTADNPEG